MTMQSKAVKSDLDSEISDNYDKIKPVKMIDLWKKLQDLLANQFKEEHRVSNEKAKRMKN